MAGTHLQERVELLLFLPVHISFLKELEVGDEAPTRSDMPRGMFLCGFQGDGVDTGLRNEGTAGEGC